MRIRFTSIVWEEIGGDVQLAHTALQDSIRPLFENEDYGANIEEFLGVFVAVDVSDNRKFAKPFNKTGYITNMMTGRKYRHTSLAIEFDPSELTDHRPPALIQLFASRLIDRLKAPDVKIPSGFDYARFAADLRAALATHVT